MLTAVLCVVSFVLIVIVGLVSYSKGYSDSKSDAVLGHARSKVAHLNSLKRVHEAVIDLANKTNGPVEMRNHLTKLIGQEIEKRQK